MSDLLSGLDKLGLSNLSDIDIYEEHSKVHSAGEHHEEAVKVIDEAEYLLDKTFECPVCGKKFKSKVVKQNRARMENIDSDLRPNYKGVDPLKYDAIVCTNCGYASLSRYFDFMTHTYAKMIKENISTKFVNTFKESATYSYDDAITRHKLALLNSVYKRAKDSEKAYICLKIAWLIRGKAKEVDVKDKAARETVCALRIEEREFIIKAYEGFQKAYSSEAFPMCGMDEATCLYMNADIARKLGKYDEAMSLVSKILLSRNVNERIKGKARDLKDRIREEEKTH